MGRLVVEQMVSADGFAAEADGGLGFHEAAAGAEVDADQLELLERADAILLGRRTYELFAAFWPFATVADAPVAEPIGRLPKHVVSNSLDRAPWGDGEIAVERGDGVEVARRLRDRYARDVIVWGSLTLTDALFAAGVVDVLRLRIVPRLLGGGRGFTPPLGASSALRLVGVRGYPGGQVTVEYGVDAPS